MSRSSFINEPLTDFTIAANRSLFAKALDVVEKNIQNDSYICFPLINGKSQKTSQIIDSFDPSNPSVRIGKVHYADNSLVNEAFNSLNSSSWAEASNQERASVIRKVALLMKAQRLELAALIVREAGKPWKEADADVAEAIDFCEYYAFLVETALTQRKTQQVAGEDNVYFYKPKGIAIVIAPWNFPLAIACGMTVAALVTGNTTILKPAEQTSLIAYLFSEILLKAGVPSNAFAFLPGIGEEIGRALVSHPKTSLICFTGSKNVGLEITKTASVLQTGQTHIKKVIAELGGKNCIIIDEDADLDEAIKGVLYSAFAYAGQKCSACSRLICVEAIYNTFITRLCEAASDLIVGEAKDPASYIGPVIDNDSQKRILETISSAKKQLKVAFQGTPPQNGFFVPHTIFKDVDENHPIWKEEIFGPVLACRKSKDFVTAVAEANNSAYALTGGVFSRSPNNIDYARKHFNVGNLYINRSCTGAMVCRQPFGGFKLSGIGSKAGGPDYLLQFVEPRCITENTMRRGFAPE
jgi:RHH-type transcriptional regulator, proline utilization regulon repressor / proline dehydrogenase / delta 1-pyrroline-5-carboxylate dehydrogenase